MDMMHKAVSITGERLVSRVRQDKIPISDSKDDEEFFSVAFRFSVYRKHSTSH